MTAPENCVSMVDVSAAQGETIDWTTVRASGVQRVSVEHGVGNDAANACRVAQVHGAQAAGLLVGRYDFLYPIGIAGAGRSPAQQAALHAALAVPGVVYDLPDVADLEWPEPTQWGRWGCSMDQIVQWTLAYANARPTVTRLYTMPGFVAALGHPTEFARFDLWLAEWGVTSPTVPSPWTQWAAWQHSSDGTVPGIPGPVDLSWCRLSPDDVDTAPDISQPGLDDTDDDA